MRSRFLVFSLAISAVSGMAMPFAHADENTERHQADSSLLALEDYMTCMTEVLEKTEDPAEFREQCGAEIDAFTEWKESRDQAVTIWPMPTEDIPFCSRSIAD